MSFTELNAVEHYIIKELTGVNLNDNSVSEPTSPIGFGWRYKSHKELSRGIKTVELYNFRKYYDTMNTMPIKYGHTTQTCVL